MMPIPLCVFEPDFKSTKLKGWNPEYKQLLRGVYDY